MNLSLEGRNAIVCGGSDGIGFAIAEELALMGANCILLSRNEEKLKTAVSQLDIALRQKHSYYPVDFNDVEATKALIAEITSQKIIHILINNSGGPPAGPITEAGEDAFLNAFNQHLVTAHLFTKGVMEGMKKDHYGRIINVISTSVKIPLRNLGVSNTIRGAVASWAKTMANELGQYNITVNNILPGFTSTQRLRSIIDNTARKSNVPIDIVEQNMKEEVPMKRFGEASEIASVAAFLASPAASYVNGVSIPVDGGRTGSI